jgi:hypothetical protein
VVSFSRIQLSIASLCRRSTDFLLAHLVLRVTGSTDLLDPRSFVDTNILADALAERTKSDSDYAQPGATTERSGHEPGGRPDEECHLPDVSHPEKNHHQATEAEPESAVRWTPVPEEIQIVGDQRRIEVLGERLLVQNGIMMLALCTC